VESVRRINRRWIVHGGLRDTAAAYLAELGQSDPDRLRASCQLAMELVHSKAGHADPKPWFYVGLFAHARPHEAERFLASHPFTRAAWEILHDVPCRDGAPGNLILLARQIAQEIRTR